MSSEHMLDTPISHWLKATPATHYLDIGCGSGKYGKIIRAHNPAAKITGIEIDSSYVLRHNVSAIYDQVFLMDAANIPDAFDLITDVAIMGDLIEHLRKSDGLDLLHYLLYRCYYLLIVYPHDYLQYGTSIHPAEAHRSLWNVDDFQSLTTILQYHAKQYLSAYILEGLLGRGHTPQSALNRIKKPSIRVINGSLIQEVF